VELESFARDAEEEGGPGRELWKKTLADRRRGDGSQNTARREAAEAEKSLGNKIGKELGGDMMGVSRLRTSEM